MQSFLIHELVLHGDFCKITQMSFIIKSHCEYEHLKAVENVLEVCPVHPAKSAFSKKKKKKISPEFGSRELLVDTKKDLETVIEFLDLLPHFIC